MRLILNFTPIEKWIPYRSKPRWGLFLRPSCLSWKPPLVAAVLVGVSRNPWVYLGFGWALLVLLWTLAAQALPGNPQARLDLPGVCSCLAPLWCSNKCFESLSCQAWGRSARMAGQGQPRETGAWLQLHMDTCGRGKGQAGLWQHPLNTPLSLCSCVMWIFWGTDKSRFYFYLLFWFFGEFIFCHFGCSKGWTIPGLKNNFFCWLACEQAECLSSRRSFQPR